MLIFCYFVVLCLAVWCAVSDIICRRIPNIAVISLVIVAIVMSLQTRIWVGCSEFLVAVFVGFALYLLRCFGAGDIKYFWACMLIVPNQVELLLLSTALFGLLLAIVYLAKHRFHPKEVGTIPYGVAISSGVVLCLCRVMF